MGRTGRWGPGAPAPTSRPRTVSNLRHVFGLDPDGVMRGMNARNAKLIQWKTAPRRHEPARMTLHRAERATGSNELQQLTRRYDELTAIAVQLVEECARLRTENDDLRASAELWIRMYENQIERAKSFEEQLLGGPRRG